MNGIDDEYKICDIRVYYNQEYRDIKAGELEKLGYQIARYDGIVNYMFMVLSVPR